jgi:hypothetical protein
MRARLFVLVIVGLVVFAPAAASGDEPDPFVGSWVGIDGFDGSRNTLVVGGGNLHVVYRETAVTACLGGFGELVPGSAQGFGTIDGDTLTFTGTLYCKTSNGLKPHPNFTDFEWKVVYDDGSGSETVSLVADDYTVLGRRGS